jgi:hypothetical protein
VDAENRRNRGIIADAVKQMVLVIISLGFSNAFMILAKPAEKNLHLFSAACRAETESCPVVQYDSRLIFAIYVLIGTRFLLTSWVYLSTTYRDDNPKTLRILPDAIGIFLTGILIGVQSSYASADWMPDFFLLFLLVLLVDVISSVASIIMNLQAVKDEGLSQELWWIGNNFVFGIATFAVLIVHLPYDPTRWPAGLLMSIAFLNCAISLGVTWRGYFRAKRVPSKYTAEQKVMAVVLAKRGDRIRVDDIRQWLSTGVANDGQ